MPSWVELVACAVCATGLFGMATFVGWLAALRLVGRRDLALRVASTVVASSWTLTALFHLLQPLGAFRLGWALACWMALATGLAWFARARVRGDLRREGRTLGRLLALSRRSPNRFALFLFGSFASVVAARALLLPPLGWDTLTYHGPRAALWVQNGQATFDPGPGTWELYRHFFSGSESLVAWAMLPFHSDLLAGFVQVVQWAGVFAAVWAFGRSIGLREPFGSSAATAVACVPTLWLLVGSGYVEPLLLLGLVTGSAAALRALEHPRPGLVLVAAAALGLALGAKLPAIPVAAMAALVAMVALLRLPMSLIRRVALLGAALFVLAVPVLPWMLLALRETGYPLSPAAMTLGDLRLGVTSPGWDWFLDRPEIRPLTFGAEWDALRRLFGPIGSGEGLGFLTALELLLFPFGWLALARRRPAAATFALLACLAQLAFFYSAGFAVLRLLWSRSSARVLLSLVAVALPVSLAWAPRAPRLARFARLTMLAIAALHFATRLQTGMGQREPLDLTLCLAVVCACLWLVARAARRSGRAAAGASLALTSLFLVGLQCHTWTARADYARESFQIHSHPKEWARAAELVDEPARTHVVAITSGPSHNSANWFAYFLFGRRLQNRLVYVPPSRDGTIHSFGPAGELETKADKQAWIERLAQREVTEVMSFLPRSLELGWMQATPERFEHLAGGLKWALYRFRR